MDIKKYLSRGIIEAGIDTSHPIMEKAAKWQSEGVDIVRMDMGTPDLDSPEAAKEAAIEALRRGDCRYTHISGIEPLRKAIAKKEKRDKGVEFDPQNEIIITVGASEANALAYTTFLDPGDEIIVPVPGYVAYMYVLYSLGVKVVEVPIVKDCKVNIDIDEFEKYITDKTKMILLNSPQNPTGMAFTHEELEKLAAIAIKHDLLVISDECYEKYLFEGKYESIYTIPGMAERTIVINSVSKTYGMTGWRVGWLAAKKELCEYMRMLHVNLLICAPSFAQYGAVAAIENETEEQIKALQEPFDKKKKHIIEALDSIECLDYIYPKGAFYVFVNVEKTGMTGLEFSNRFLDEYKVSSCPGEVYGRAYKNYVRFAYTCTYERTVEAMERLKQFVGSLGLK